MNKFYEAVSVTVELPGKTDNYFVIHDSIVGKDCIAFNPKDSETVEFWKFNISHWLRPLPVPEGTLTQEDINKITRDQLSGHAHGHRHGLLLIECRKTANEVLSRLTPLIASQQAEIERLKDALDRITTEQPDYTDNEPTPQP